MFGQIFRFDPGANILVPALPGPNNLLAPVKFGANLTLPAGLSLGIVTATNLGAPFNKDASDGSQNWAGFNQQAGVTDNNGIFYNYTGSSGAAQYYSTGIEAGTMYTSGVFDPFKVATAVAGSVVAEVDTITPGGTITQGDINVITLPNGTEIQFTTGSTTTATAVVTGLKAAWAANPEAVALATTSGTTTLILTAVTPGSALNLATSVIGVGTLVKVITTPAGYGAQGEVDTFTPGGTVTTGDVWTLTLALPNLNTYTVTATVGATATATAISGLVIAAWNSSTVPGLVATASGTATIILTANNVGSTMNVSAAVVGTGTVSKSVTTPAYGRNLADIQISRPSAYILQPYGYWNIV